MFLSVTVSPFLLVAISEYTELPLLSVMGLPKSLRFIPESITRLVSLRLFDLKFIPASIKATLTYAVFLVSRYCLAYLLPSISAQYENVLSELNEYSWLLTITSVSAHLT